ncbi:hypothetical protein DDP54_11000 [Cellulomonas sp. WB94]|uniref:hypothetical protein n=1 Tax=Cellulomonas sp. WB94 TaxID=2173174 RepID=UPI000D5660DB|nr:hypothetical protein [Cellulomonas sp. WB94]PVU83434.1 hypothetical protein DDP54_11000 [Cellulomonas sp. WB94]
MSATEVTQLLEEWESRLRDLGAPCIERLRPGLTRAQVDALTLEHDLHVSDEVAAIWMWHDGDTGPDNGLRGLTPMGRFFDLRGSLDNSRSLQRITFDGDDDGDYSDEDPGDELYFRRHYLMIIVDEDRLYVDCTPGTSGTSGTSTGLYLSHDLSRATRVDLLDRLRLWLDALNRGLWRIDTNGSWVVDASQAPVDRFWPWLYT